MKQLDFYWIFEDQSINKAFDYTVCFCKGVSYLQIVKTIREDIISLEGLHQKLGLCSGCRTCKKEIELILKNELEKSSSKTK